MLSLTEELFLLCLFEKKSTITLPYSAGLPYVLAGAMLVELVLAGKIRIDKGRRIEPIGGLQIVEGKHINELLNKIQGAAKPRKISHWIVAGAARGKKLEKDILAELIDQGVLKEEEKRIMLTTSVSDNSQLNTSAKYYLKQNLRDVVLGGKIADQKSVVLLCFLKANSLLDHIFTLDEIRAAAGRVDKIFTDETNTISAGLLEAVMTISSEAVAVAEAITSMK